MLPKTSKKPAKELLLTNKIKYKLEDIIINYNRSSIIQPEKIISKIISY